MSSAKVPPSDFKGTVKVGITTGLVAGVALFAVFLSIDQQLGLTNGLFFKTMIAAFGVEPILAIFIGLCASAIVHLQLLVLVIIWCLIIGTHLELLLLLKEY